MVSSNQNPAEPPIARINQVLNDLAIGVLQINGEEIVLELSTVNGWTWAKSPPSQVHIPLKQVEALEYKRNSLHVTLLLRVRSMEILASVPGSNGVEIVLHCRRKYKHLTQEFTNLITFQLLDRVFPAESSVAST